YKDHIQSMIKARNAGVKIALGTDFAGCDPVDHGENALELKLLVEDVGLSPMEAIVAGTKTAAESLSLGDKLGTIEPGKQADMLVVKHNPTEDINVLAQTENIEMVFLKGQLLKDLS